MDMTAEDRSGNNLRNIEASCRFLGLTVRMSCAWLCLPVLAQDIPAKTGMDEHQTPTTLDTIQVTAQFRTQNLQETPLAITAMTSEMMEARSQYSVLDIASAAPNVNISPTVSNYGSSGASVSIRGVGQNDSSFALEPGVGIYIDDVYYPTMAGSDFDLLDLERVEILRGPQGTLAGKNSIGGAIKLYSRVPDEIPGGMLETTVGAFNRRDLRAMGNFVLGGDTFLRLSGVSRKRDGYLTRYDYGCRFPDSGFSTASARGDCVLGHEGGERYQGIRAALRWVSGQQFELNLIADASDMDNEPPATRALVSPDLRFITDERYVSYSTYEGNGWNAVPESTLASRGVSGKLDWRSNPRHHLTSITSYREYGGDYGIDTDGSPISLHTLQWKIWNHTFTQELRFNGTALQDRLDYTFGAYYADSTSGLEGIVDIPGLFAYQEDPVVSRNKSVFAHAMYRISDRLEVSAGVRFTDESKQYTFTRLDPVSRSPVNDIHGQIGYYEGDRLDYRLAGVWRLGAATMLYASYATGFRGGGINPRPFIPAQVLPFQPEELESYEVGLKTDLMGRRLRINSALFFNDYERILVTITNGFAGFPRSAIPINAGAARVRGAEIEATTYPVEGLAIDASYSYLDFEYTRLSQAALASNMDYWMVMRYMSKNKGSFGIQYDVPFTSGVLIPRLDISYYSDFFTDTTNSEISRVKGQALSSARLTWRPHNADWEIAVGASNLFDRYYYSNIHDVVPASGIATAIPGRPREWFVSFKYHF